MGNIKNISTVEPPIFISGCARSGTSMVAGIIDKCGAFGGHTTPALPHNRKGQFENDVLRNLLKGYLAEQGYDKLGQKPLPEIDKLQDWPEFKDHVSNVFKSQGYTGGLCYYKGAKLCLIWNIIHKNFPNSKWIFVRRPDDDIIRSCLKTRFMQKRKTFEEWQEWINHHLNCLSQMRRNGLDVTEIWSNKLIKGDFSEIKSFIEKAGLEWDEQVVRDFIEPELYGGE